MSETLEEVAQCKRSNVMINTFMLAQDSGLVQFVHKVSEMCRGKTYFTTPDTLGQYLLRDYMQRKSKIPLEQARSARYPAQPGASPPSRRGQRDLGTAGG